MNILKTKKLFTYMVVGALVMALSISCKSNEDPNSGDTKKEDPKTEEKTFASYEGTWYGDLEMDGSVEKPIITINSDGSFTLIASGLNYPSSSITRNSDKSYTYSYEGMTISFNFSSDTQATVDFGGGTQVPITRK